MKVTTIFGTRPEIIRLSKVIEKLDRVCDQTLIHTGQNYDPNLSDIFFSELGVRQPDAFWGVQGGGFGSQIAEIVRNAAETFERDRPDRVLILGDTNSGLAAIIAARMGIPVYHMEAGNRCFDDRVPEEINRRIIDNCSTILMPYTQRSKELLVREGFARERIYVTGNPIFEVMTAFDEQIEASDVLARHELDESEYFVVTAHRADNVDDPVRLQGILSGLDQLANEYGFPVIVSLHPRTRDKMQCLGLKPKSPQVKLIEPVGFFDFVKLEGQAFCVLTDSGTVQEEAAILGTPNVILRDVTERAETLEMGSGILSGADPEAILSAVQVATECATPWIPPTEYMQDNVSSVVAQLVMGYRPSNRQEGLLRQAA